MIQVIGHRGARDLAPENTLAGFALARELGCHAVEMDLQLTKDRKLVLMHDSTLDRTTEGSGPVASFALSELRRFDAGDGERIPTLDEVLEFLRPSRLLLQIELKGEGTELIAPETVRRHQMATRVRFTSFFHRRVLEAKKQLPEVTTGVLTDTNPVDPVQMLRSAHADTYHIKHPRLDQRLVEEVHAAGHAVVAMGKIVDVQTVNQVTGYRVDAIGSDRPDLVIKRLQELQLYAPP